MAHTAIVGVLNCRLNALLLADPADSLVVHFHMLVMPQIIRNSAVPFSAEHLCSWTGICPGNRGSAGKRKSGRTNKGNATLKTTLIQCANQRSR